MSQKNQKFAPDPEQSSTSLGDKKGGDTDLNVDSGIMSSENLIYYDSGNIEESSDNIPTTVSEEKLDCQKLQSVETLDSGIIEDREPSMHIDSGLCEVQSKLDHLSIGNQRLNNLSRPLSSTSHSTEPQMYNVSQPQTEAQSRRQTILKYFQQNEDGDTTLHTAIETGHVELSSALIKVAPVPELLDIANDDAQTPLHVAVETQQWQIVRHLMVAGASPSHRDIRGDSPLHIAARLGDLNCVKAILIDIRPQEYQMFSVRPTKPLGYATNEARKVLAQWNYMGQTPVHVAAINGHTAVIGQLVACGADINDREGLGGYTSLHFAVKRRDDNMVYFLLHSVPSIVPNTRSYEGKTAWQDNPVVSKEMQILFKTSGMESPFTSEDEDDSSDEEMYDRSGAPPAFVANFIMSNA